MDGTDLFAERVFDGALGYFRILSMYLGLRLGLYEALQGSDGVTAEELAAAAAVDARYAREWLEQQATIGVLTVDGSETPARFRLPAAAAEVLLDQDSLAYLGATIRQLASLRGVIDPVVDAFQHGGGILYEDFSDEGIDGQGGSNRPLFLTTMPGTWVPAIGAFHDRLQAGPTRVFDIGCGHGWSSIGLATAYPNAVVDGFDPDPLAIERARAHAASRDVADRVHFHAVDAATIEGAADLAMAFECIHDMSDPVSVLTAARRALADDGAMLIVDERTRDAFDGTPDELEAYFYGWSIFDCLPAGIGDGNGIGTGTVMRPDTLRRYANDAGFTGFEKLPIEHDTFRLYLLTP